MPYDKPSDAPDYIPESKKAQWVEVFNSAYKKAKKDGKSDKDAESSAFAQATGVTGSKEGKSMSTKLERRFIATEVRAEKEGDKKILTGYAAKFNTLSDNLGGFREAIKPGAFSKSIKEKDDVKMLVNHDPSLIVGRTGANLDLKEDGTGLRFRVALPDTSVANDLHENVRAGVMNQCSFGFIPRSESWTNMRDGGYADVSGDGGNQGFEDKKAIVRELHDVMLKDVSAVTSPAYPDTELKAREGKLTALEIRSLFPDGIPEEVARHMAEALEERDAKTKRVGGKDLPASAFAYVGDPQDTATWKYPVHDESHARNALARWGQHKGIPSDKEAGVYKKIVAAAKKFGIEVSEEDHTKAARQNLDAYEKRHGVKWEVRHDKWADIAALAPKVKEAMESLEECLDQASEDIEDEDGDSWDDTKVELAQEVKALDALLGSLEKAVDKEVAEDGGDDGERARHLKALEIAASL
jgi:hypothetical protein